MKSSSSKYILISFKLMIINFLVLSCTKEEINLEVFDFTIPDLEYKIMSYKDLDSTLNENDFHMDSILVRKMVPKIFVDQIQPSIKELKRDEKKRNFIRILLSHTLKFNNELLETRLRLIKTLNKDQIQQNDSLWLDSLAIVYRVNDFKYFELIKKIDVIPPSLIIVQGIIESGWATSKYAVNGNNLFGLYGSKKVKTKSGRLRPRAKKFDDIKECVEEYITNLNRHFAYRKMRKVRAEMRELGVSITGRKLAGTLMNYSTLGERYVRKIVSMINLYDLEDFDQYTFDLGPVIYIRIEE